MFWATGLHLLFIVLIFPSSFKYSQAEQGSCSPPPLPHCVFFFLHNTVGGAKPKHMTLGTGHWCVAMVYETLSPQINARCKEEKEVEKRMAGSHHCQPSRSPYRTKGGRAVCSSEENWWEGIDHPDERISLDVKKNSLLFLEENPTFEKAESPNV